MRKQFIFCIAVMLAASMLLCGCGHKKEKGIAKKLLEEKYGEPFEVTWYRGSEAGKKYYAVTARAKAWRDLPFEANIDNDGSRVSDSYVCRRVCAELSDRINDRLSERLPYDTFVHAEFLSSDSTCQYQDIDPEEFMTVLEPYNLCYVYIHVSSRDKEDENIVSAVADAVSDMPYLNGNVTVYYSDKDTIKDVRRYIRINDRLYDSYFDIVERSHEAKYRQFRVSGGRLYDDISGRMAVSSRSERVAAEKVLRTLFIAMETGNTEAIKSMFSPYAKENAADLDGQIRELARYYPGITGDYDAACASREGSDRGVKNHELNMYVDVPYTGGEYKMHICIVMRNDTDTTMEGVHLIELECHERNDGSKWKTRNDPPGVYVWK